MSRLRRVILEDVFHEHSILLGATILCNSLFVAFFVCFSGGVREKDGMIGEIIDEGPHPVRVFQGNLESKVGTQSWWGPSCGCNIDLGPNLRKEAQLQTSNFAKLGSKLGSKSDHKLCYCETPYCYIVFVASQSSPQHCSVSTCMQVTQHLSNRCGSCQCKSKCQDDLEGQGGQCGQCENAAKLKLLAMQHVHIGTPQ